jgi:hypothetical protein
MINQNQLAKIVGRDVREDECVHLVATMRLALAGREEEALRFTEVFYDLIKPDANTMEVITAAKELGVLSKLSPHEARNLISKVKNHRAIRGVVGPESSTRALTILAAFASGVYSTSSSLFDWWKATRLLMKSGNFAKEWRIVPYVAIIAVKIPEAPQYEWVDDPYWTQRAYDASYRFGAMSRQAIEARANIRTLRRKYI